MVDQTNLAAVYPPDDGRPGISCAQWLQYQLDNYATVNEVINHLGDLRPDGEGWHYLIADRSGACAVIEYLNGVPHVITGDQLTVPALTNTTYEQAFSHLRLDKAFGGETDIAAGNDSYGRFCRIAQLLRSFDPERSGPAAGYALKILAAVSCEMTLRSVVYDAGDLRVLWRTRSQQEVRWLDLARLDFSAGRPTLILDITAPLQGDVTDELTPYTVQANRKTVLSIMGSGPRDPDVEEMLTGRGLNRAEACELIALHPTSGAPSGR
jgi:choloylglycine hydrolase